MTRILRYLIILSCLTELTLSQEATLKFLQILFRHGDRTPTDLYKNDPNQVWDQGLGQLTNKGKLQMYQLGANIRHDYKNFLSEYYLPNDVYILSSENLRTRMSAELVLAGLYPPVKKQIWNENLLWQPIPINYIPRKLDNLIALRKPCPVFGREFGNALKSDRVQQFHEKYKELYEYLSKNSGDQVDTLGEVETLYNTLMIEKEHKKILPDWVNNLTESDFETMKYLGSENLALYTSTPILKRVMAGFLLREMTTKMLEKSNNATNLSLALYSGHDLTIVSLMRTMGFTKLLKPDYGASIIMELHEINNEYEVRFLYRKNYSASLEQENIGFCSTPCSLNTFIREAQLLYPADWEKECNDL